MDLKELNLLERRKIEAEMAATIIHGYIKELGYSKAISITMDSIEKLSKNNGHRAAEDMGSNRLQDLVKIMKSWSSGGLLQEEILEETETTYFFNVTRCLYAEAYETMGVKQFGYCLSCCRDQPFVEGFNPGITFKRTQTIMEGAAFCDFRFSLDS
ncbi:MAG: L-2-amino-thiazoline-4-carboxylic acid hydrolase [Desulfobacula sp.]|jgi:hypothetical protein|uniref:L-2-amino-thiazoline-4-carboxylic acid hydrolase n=1 Tax=Desulfobacula sp. TaxID=2593537 RepID=UPI001D60BFC5|nr:L-2-amino-thiazoline-4-carboxylic acid hydrolase [Desulfobacula sp.]MBT3803568.1 L-2-amino-thiazoline-4-carboxylic acid hydrolase [Desulfobacula sp.]MBT4025706.1 L-2-amino-thiazoline-4-carboxylic acid hydrolase [Desulfobacula sp.]MBT4199176.1 L-2-amino-thiazoline-4-carboxylic acid hydrolase [Desulfobacula sp.]MBT4874013.1 L-2-amino-thiazoline-4-carboxylic acid hydrolase [Desulfobacula sp.]